MRFNLNDFLRATSNALDFIEADIFGVPSNHSKRIAYISFKIGKELHLKDQELYDLVSLAILHDNGASLKVLHDQLRGNTKEKLNIIESIQEHCIIGEENIMKYPFLTKPQDIIKYHHEKYDGSGFFKLFGDDIPMLSQIISFSDILDLNFDLKNICKNIVLKDMVVNYVYENKDKYFSSILANIFLNISDSKSFWNELSDEAIDKSIKDNTPSFSKDFTYAQIHDITKTFSKIIDAKSQFTQQHSSELSNKLERMALFYKKSEDEKMKLLISADLHDLGKLAISNGILDKPGSLLKEEFEQIKRHPEIARMCLQEINGFEDITEWACNHHERLNGKGYPRGLTEDQLDFNSRLLACLDIYQALREERPYRKALSHGEAIEILDQMTQDGLVDRRIVMDIKNIFSRDY